MSVSKIHSRFLIGSLVLLICFFGISKVSHAYVFCSSLAGQSTCLSICQSVGYGTMVPGTGVNGQASGLNGWYCSNSSSSTDGVGAEDLPDAEAESTAVEKHNFNYLTSAGDSSVNIYTLESGYKSGVGKFFDNFFGMMKNFYKNLFTGNLKDAFSPVPVSGPGVAREGSHRYQTVSTPDGCFARRLTLTNMGWVVTAEYPFSDNPWDFANLRPCDGRVIENNPTAVPDDASVDSSNQTDLYCEVDQSLSIAEQKSKIKDCAEKSDLSLKEKEAVIKSLN